MREEQRITSIDDLVNIVEQLSTDIVEHDLHHAHLRMWFRGHSDSSWQLSPGVYRPDFTPINEDDRLSLEQHLSQDFRAVSVSRLNGQETPTDLYFLQQHYGMPTRLLDWTSNSLVALWFAVNDENYLPKQEKDRKKCSATQECEECKKYNEGKDGEIFMMDVYQMKPDPMPKNFGIASPRHPTFKKALNTILKWGKLEEFPRFIIPVRPDHKDWRIRQQQSFFTFHVPDAANNELSTKMAALTKDHNGSLKSYIIPKENKRTIKTNLGLLGIDAFTVYGDLNNLSKGLIEVYISRFKNRDRAPKGASDIKPMVAGADEQL